MTKFKLGDKVNVLDEPGTTECSKNTRAVGMSGEIIRIESWRGQDHYFITGSDCCIPVTQLQLACTFKAGDRVKNIPKGYVSAVPMGSHGTVTSSPSKNTNNGCVTVKFDGLIRQEDYHPDYLEKIEPQTAQKPLRAWSNSLTYTRSFLEEVGEVKPEMFIKPTKKPLIMKLNAMMKQLLDADTQTLVKAGYINGDLEMTSDGEDALLTILFVANKAALVTDAQAKLDAEKK